MKPLLLTFNELFSPKNKNKPTYLFRLKEKYDFFHIPLDYTKTPFELIEGIINYLKSKGIVLDGVISLYDTESIVASYICDELRLIGPKPISIFRAQHKAIFSKIACKINPSQPLTYLINLNDIRVPKMDYPAFLRTVKGGGSRFAYIIHSKEELEERLNLLKGQKRPDLEWYDLFFDSFKTPSKKSRDLYLLQPFIEGKQYTADGFVCKGQVKIVDYTETIYSPDRKSFVRFDFPAQLDEKIKLAVSDLAQKLIQELDYDNAGFNLEFFVTNKEEVVLIELNTRPSLQFIPLFDQKYTDTIVDMVCKVALGQKSLISQKKQPRAASSFPLRAWKNYKVISVPSKIQIKKLLKEKGVLGINIFAKTGEDLTHLKNDAYSYRYGIIDMAGEDLQEILARFDKMQKKLGIVFEES